MLLAIDVGNTNITIGLFQEEKLTGQWRLSTDQHKTRDELGLRIGSLLEHDGFEGKHLRKIVVSSVVPYLNRPLKEGLRKYLGEEPVFLRPGEESPIDLEVDEPRAVGPDRIANCIGAHQIYGGPGLIIDFGTAINFDLYSGTGGFLGGAISPEMEVALEALYRKAALLPEIELAVPDSVVGKTTTQTMNAGFVLGFISMIEGMIKRFEESYREELNIVATGGKGELICGEIEKIEEYEEYLALEGLRIWWDKYRRY